MKACDVHTYAKNVGPLLPGSVLFLKNGIHSGLMLEDCFPGQGRFENSE